MTFILTFFQFNMSSKSVVQAEVLLTKCQADSKWYQWWQQALETINIFVNSYIIKFVQPENVLLYCMLRYDILIVQYTDVMTFFTL